ncbi:serine/threonine protein kinase [Cedratvirus lausannensis]|uniref:non-specific serine/threonine protein kinase n=1 Tax=Cedratvirus lausannensis TaxID=2023205 RepID=A0A285PXS3_9VIRU|nr:serine/threonine protein kinase [Cedratvirus lausannensis]
MYRFIFLLCVLFSPSHTFDLTLVHSGETFSQVTAIDGNYNPCQPINGTYVSEAGPCWGGMDRRQGLINQVKTYANNVLLVDSGSLFTHSLFWIVYNSTSMASYYKNMGYHAVSLSIYEFITELDYLAYFSTYLEPGTKLLASNLYGVNANSKLSNVTISPYVVVEYAGGERVAYTSTTVAGIGSLFRDPGPINSYDELSSMLASVGELQNMGVNKIIACISSKDVFDSIIPYVPGIDVVILPDVYYANHAEPGLETPSKTYPQVRQMPWKQPLLIVGSGSYATNLGILNITFDDNGVITAYQGNAVALSDSAPSDAVTYAQVQADYEAMISALGDTIGIAAIDIQYQGQCVFAECAIGDWSVDVLRSRGGTQIGLFNGGSIYGQIAAGSVTLGEVLKVFPFASNNQLWTLSLDGYSILQALEHSVSLANDTTLGINADIGRFFQISGLNFTWNPEQPVGKRVVDVWVEEQTGRWSLLDYSKSYNITTLDFTVQGGDEYTVFMEKGTNIVNTGFYALTPLEEALHETLDKRSPLYRVVEGRISTSNLTRQGCISGGNILCNGNGYCLEGVCVCTVAEASGPLCSLYYSEDSSTSLSTGGIIGIVTGVSVFVVGVVLLLMFVIFLVSVFYLPRRKETEDWLISLGELEMGESLGSGGFGEVNKALWKGTEVAVKMLHEKNSLSNERRKAFADEIRIMARLRHPNVVLFMAASNKPPRMFIVMEWMSLGSLYDLLHNELVPVIPPALVVRMMFQAAKGMHFLHSSDIIHGDFKSLNLLLDSKWNVKVSDFGLTKFKHSLQRNRSMGEAVAGSVQWMSPEALNSAAEENHDTEINITELTRSDVYSFGVVMWEVITRKAPYEGWLPAQVAVAVIRDNIRPDLGSDLKREHPEYSDYIDLMGECWATDPTHRPVFLDIMGFFQTEGNVSESSGTESSEPHMRASSYTPYKTRIREKISETSSSTTTSEPVPLHHIKPPRGRVAFAVCDLAHFNRVWQEDPYSADRIIREYIKVVRRLVFENSGYIFSGAEKHSGGTVMIAFPLPRLAANFALSLQREVQENAPTSRVSLHLAQEVGAYEKESYEEACRLNLLCPCSRVVASLSLANEIKDHDFFPREDHVLFKLYPEEEDLGEEEEDRLGLCSSNSCQWIISHEHITTDKIIGEGSYGSVSSGTYGGQEVAIKRFLLSGRVGDDALCNMRREAAILYNLDHPNMVKMLGLVINEGLIVMELVKRGSLRNVLLDQSIKLPWNLRIFLLKGAALGLKYLHESDIVHRDVKSSNLLVDEYWNVKVADFGFATMIKEQATMTKCGTPAWSAPEVLLNKKYNEKADVYSFGIVMWEVLTRSTPYPNKNPFNLGIEVIKGERPQIPQDNVDASFVEFMQRCWSEKPKDRPSMDKVVMFLNSFEEDSV